MMKTFIQLLVMSLYLSHSLLFAQKTREIKHTHPFLLNQAITSYAPRAEEVPYERFVGLGNCCVTRFQINYHLSQRFGRDPSSFGGGQLFDWLVIHDYNKFAEALENHLADLFERSDLMLGPSWAGYLYPCVKNVKYDMTWNHLFTRNGDGSIVANILDLEYETKKEKINYLIEKFKGLKHYRTLYIIAYPFIGAGMLGTIEPDKKVVCRIRHALKKLRGNSNFTLLFCSLQPKFEDFKNVYIRTIVNSEAAPYVGDFNCWHPLLSQFPFTLDQAEFDKSLLDNSADSNF